MGKAETPPLRVHSPTEPGTIQVMDRVDSLTEHDACRTCPQHRDTGAGCAVVEEAAAGEEVELDAFVAREPCYLKDHLRRFATRYLSHRPRSLLDGDDLVHEVLSRLLGDEGIRKGGFGRGLGAFLAYLRQTAVRAAITAERRERGRVRCGNCKNYGAWSGICLKDDHPWTHKELAAAGDPRKLDPPCRDFVARREPRALGEDADHLGAVTGGRFCDDRTSDVVEAVHKALIKLAEAHPRAAVVVRARLLDGRTYEELSEVPASVRTMKRDFAYGVEFLRGHLGAFDASGPDEESPGSVGINDGGAKTFKGRTTQDQDSMSPSDAPDRLRRVENAES